MFRSNEVTHCIWLITSGFFPVLTICTPLRNVLEDTSRSPPRLLSISLRFLICLISMRLSLLVLYAMATRFRGPRLGTHWATLEQVRQIYTLFAAAGGGVAALGPRLGSSSLLLLRSSVCPHNSVRLKSCQETSASWSLILFIWIKVI